MAATPLATSRPGSGTRRLPFGAELHGRDRVSLRLWAPDHARVAVVMDGVESPLTAEPGGWFTATVRGRDGSRYGFRIEGEDTLLPDPASRAQPDGPHGLSAVVDPARFAWHDAGWPGLAPHGQVVYQMHIGTFTREGTWTAAAAHLPALKALGVTVVQMMPVAEFPGEFGWGYDGVCWFAPARLYGQPDDLRAFVDEAHRLGLGVILDVVYNHFGPDGNYLSRFAHCCVSTRHENEWGDPLNYDGPGSEGMRALVVANAEYWIREFHLDGFRFDATQQMFDDSPEHILALVTRKAREAAGGRGLLLIAENEPQHAMLMRSPDRGGRGLDLLYNDDLHHTARVRLVGIREAYYSDYRGTSQEFVSATRRGFLYQGQYYGWQRKLRGEAALDLPPWKFLAFLENHDQVANSASGQRLAATAAPGLLRALTALLLLGPATPLIFQGQETGSERPFRFFADHRGQLAEDVAKGRREFLAQFLRLGEPEVASDVRPDSRESYTACILDHADTPRSRRWLALYRDLLALRHHDPVLARQPAVRPEGAVLSADAFLLRWLEPEGEDRLLVVNMGHDLEAAGLPEPLVAPPAGRAWSLAWSSEAVDYGGSGTPLPTRERWLVPGYSAVLVVPVEASA